MSQPTLTESCDGVLSKFQANAPQEARTVINGAKHDVIASFDTKGAIQPGTALPVFELPNAKGEKTRSAELLAKGPLLISFYRGSWCPFCSLELAALQRRVDDIRARGVTLVAISPELPDTSLDTVAKNELKFEVLSDVNDDFARKLGLEWVMPESMRPVMKAFGHNLEVRNGTDSLAVPVPATILVDKDGIVRNTFVNPDYSKRLEPDIAIQWIDAL